MTNRTTTSPAARALRPAVALLALLTLAGCSGMAGIGGTSHYACKAPPGIQCDSVSGNYHNAIAGNLPSQHVHRTPAAGARAPAVRASSMPGPAGASAPAELRAGPRLVRMWVKAWEDADRDLIDQTYVYLQVDGGRWLVEHARARARDDYAPLRLQQGTPSGDAQSGAGSEGGESAADNARPVGAAAPQPEPVAEASERAAP